MALTNMEIFEREGVLDNVRALEGHLGAFFGAVELDADDASRRFDQADSVLQIAPPLIGDEALVGSHRSAATSCGSAGAARCGRRPRPGSTAPVHLDRAPRARRDRRADRAVELPADDGRVEGRAALAAGNVVVLKPSELTPLTTLRVPELADVLPPGVLHVVTGDERSVGAGIVTYRDVCGGRARRRRPGPGRRRPARRERPERSDAAAGTSSSSRASWIPGVSGSKESGYGKDPSVYSLDDSTRVKHGRIRLG